MLDFVGSGAVQGGVVGCWCQHCSFLPSPLLSLSHLLLISAVLNYPAALACVCITAFPPPTPPEAGHSSYSPSNDSNCW